MGYLMRHPAVRYARLAAAAAGTVFAAACKDNTTNPVGPVASLAVVQGAQSAQVGTAGASPVVLVARDQAGHPVTNVSISLATTDGSVGTSSTVTTDQAGEAVISWTLGTVAKLDTLTASVPDAPGVAPVMVVDTAVAGPPAQVQIVSGGNQTGTEGTALATPLVVRVLDSYGNPVPNVAVTFSDDQGGSFAAVTLTTDATGTVTDAFTLPANAGVDDITVTVNGPSGPMTATTEETATT
jgi:adhesin/invasin